MFDFEKLDVYQKVKELNVKVLYFLKDNKNLDPYVLEQWKRASLSILLNLTEGTGRMSDADKRNFLTIARGSVFECVAILDLVNSLKLIDKDKFEDFYLGYESISKMLLGMYRSYSKS